MSPSRTRILIERTSELSFMFDEDELAEIRAAREDWEEETLDPFLDRYH